MTATDAIDATLQQMFDRNEAVQYWFLGPTGETRTVCRGLANRSPPRRATPRTTFHCFSTTKPITALALLQLEAEGRVDLDAPIATLLPEVPYRNGATVRQLLSHQAGLPNPMPLSWVHRDEDDADFDGRAFVDRVLREHPSCDPPGRRARYSNIGFLLLGRIVEQLAARPYTTVVQERILDVVRDRDPDGYLGFAIPEGRHATGYTRRWSALGLMIALMRDAPRLRSNERAWIRYRPFHLDGAAYGGLKGNARGWAPLLSAIARADPRLLAPRSYERWFEPQPLASGKPSGHALAWFTGTLRGHEFRCHAGGGPGYGAEIRVYPALGAASMLVTNTTIVRDLRLLDRLDPHWLA